MSESIAPSVPFLVLSHVVLDDIVLPDGTTVLNMLGGAGAYAAGGASLAAHGARVGIVSGIGKDFPKKHIDWMNAADIDTSALRVVDDSTPHTLVNYRSAGDRDERPLLGLDHFQRAEPTLRLLPEDHQDARGIYAFKQADDDFWDDLAAYGKGHPTSVVWEIDAASCTPELRPLVFQRLPQVDVLSLNEAELGSLFADEIATDTTQQIVALLNAGVLAVALRSGSSGASIFTEDGAWSAKPLPEIVVDQTGAGNAFTGALLVRWTTSGGDAEASLRDAMAAAALTIRQYGPPALSPLDRIEFAALSTRISVTHISTPATRLRTP